MAYQFEATSVEGFIQQLVTNYFGGGFYRYVTGWVPRDKDPRAVDAKLLAKYRIAVSPTERQRRKAAGRANLHYLRHGRFWVICASAAGESEFFEQERDNLRDVREVPLKAFGYSIQVVRGGYLRKALEDDVPRRDGKYRVRVMVQRERLLDLKAYFLDVALRLPADELARSFAGVPFEPYARVRRQLLGLLRSVNRVRKAAGLDVLPAECVRLRKRIVYVFADPARDPLAA
jgi:hypothetical protein